MNRSKDSDGIHYTKIEHGPGQLMRQGPQCKNQPGSHLQRSCFSLTQLRSMPTTKLPGLYYKITRVDAAYREPKGNACLSSLTQKALIKGKCHAVSTLTWHSTGVDLRSIQRCLLSYLRIHNSQQFH